MHVKYRNFPVRHPAFPNIKGQWVPLLSVKLATGLARSQRLEALVDSGAADCLFMGDLAEGLGLDMTQGIRVPVVGIGSGTITVFYHKVQLFVGFDIVEIMAGFCPQLPIAGLLGRRGFFENFIVTFDCESDPAGMDISRVHRA